MSDSPAPILLKDVLTESVALARASPGLVKAVLAIQIVLGTAIDLSLDPRDAARANMMLGLPYLYLQLLVTAVALRTLGLVPEGADERRPTMGRFPAAFGLGLVYLLGVVLGLIAFVIPGLLLILRWSVSLPALLAEDRTLMDSLRRSWELTAGRLTLLLQFFALIVLAAIAVMGANVLAYPDYGRPAAHASLIVTILVALFYTAQWLMVTALYAALRRAE